MLTTKLPRTILLLLVVYELAVPIWSQSADRKLLDQAIEALGGSAFLGVQEIHATGRFFSFKHGELTGGDIFADYIKFPDKERTEFGREKRKSIKINKGNEGWTIEGKEVEPQPVAETEEFLAGFKTSFDYVMRFVITDPKTTIQNLGSEIIDFKRTDIVELRDSRKNRIVFYIDRDTRLPVKMQVRRVDESELREEHYANWHKFQGVMTPLFVSRFTGGLKTMEIRVETAAYNSRLPESLFTPAVTK